MESSSSSREPVISLRKDIFPNSEATESVRDPETANRMRQAASDVVSTYLQLTRTLGLTDVDALAVGNLKVSYVVVITNFVISLIPGVFCVCYIIDTNFIPKSNYY